MGVPLYANDTWPRPGATPANSPDSGVMLGGVQSSTSINKSRRNVLLIVTSISYSRLC